MTLPLHSTDFDLQVAGYRLRVQTLIPSAGHQTNPTLVFLHEALGSIRQWRDFPSNLVALTQCPALIYERRGYGSSAPLRKRRTLRYLHEEALETLPEVLGACQVNEAILIGHSDGGSIALIFAGSKPSSVRLRGVVTEAAHVFVEEITLEGIRQVLRHAASKGLLDRLSKFHGDKTDTLFKAWHETWLAPYFRDWNIEEYLSHISCPLLVIQGDQDEYGSLAQVESIKNKSGGPVQTLIPKNCGHIPHFQARPEVVQAMKEFILREVRRRENIA